MRSGIDGPKPLDSQNAQTAYNRVLFYLQKIIVADLRLAQTDDRYDRAIMGAVVATRVLLEGLEENSLACHQDDFIEWKLQYLKWFDRSAKKISNKKSDRDEMRKLAENEFDRVIQRCHGVRRFSEKIKNADDKIADLRYFGPDGTLVKIPPLA